MKMNVVSITEYKSSNGLSRDFKCVIPGKVVGKIIKVLSRNKKEDQVYIAFSKDGSSMTIYTGVSVVSFPLSREDFRDYSKLLNGYKGCATIDSSVFMDNVKNLWFALNKDDRFRVSLAFNGGEMTLSAGESDNTGIEVLGFNEEFHIDFNAFLLEAIVKNIPSEHFNIHFKSSSAPVMITNTDTTSESIVSVLAPLQ
jgi:DNA polymerase III sliding clamp (beta) subunit (PCNA family)